MLFILPPICGIYMKHSTLFKANTVIMYASLSQSTIMYVQHSRHNLLFRCIITYLTCLFFFPSVYINGPDPGKLLNAHPTLSRWSNPWNWLVFASVCFKPTLDFSLPQTFCFLTWSSLFARIRSNRALLCVGSSVPCVGELLLMHSRNLLDCCVLLCCLSADTGVVQASHKDQDMWMWGSFF